MTRTTRFFAIAMLATGLALAQTERFAEVQLKAAMHKEQVEGDLKAAIQLYQRIVEKYAGNKAIAAKVYSFSDGLSPGPAAARMG